MKWNESLYMSRFPIWNFWSQSSGCEPLQYGYAMPIKAYAEWKIILVNSNIFENPRKKRKKQANSVIYWFWLNRYSMCFMLSHNGHFFFIFIFYFFLSFSVLFSQYTQTNFIKAYMRLEGEGRGHWGESKIGGPTCKNLTEI